ncbi:MAG TPA: AI-2E family transporter [Candidatus Paceibacterota bacterium]|nr:AI-2E family transporter [Candidatus Paceibacterota bacterium]
MQTKSLERYFFFGLLLLTLIFTFFIFKPFWIVIVLGASFSVVLAPIHKWLLQEKVPNWLSAFLTTLFFFLIICLPLFGLGTLIFDQSQDLYYQIISGQKIIPTADSINSSINSYLPHGLSFDINEKASSFVTFITNNVSKIFSTTLSTLFSFILILLSIFYFLKDGERWERALVKLSPLSDSDDKKIIHRLSQTINGVIKGYILIALIQGLLMGLGLYFFGVPNPAFWGVVAAIASLIPSIGTALISVPAVLYLFLGGHLIPAIGLAIWAAVLVGLIDNLLSPYIVSSKIKIPAFLILFSVLGGVVLLGPVGILIGPLAMSLLFTLISIYRNEFKNDILIK